MNAREAHEAFGVARDRQVLLAVLKQVQQVTEAVLEIAGERKLETGKDPLSTRSRAILSDFIELPEDLR